MKRIYLDNNATTSVDPQVQKEMDRFFSNLYGNPNSLHSFGTDLHPEMTLALEKLYRAIRARDEDDIIITSCATESNGTVLLGTFFDQILTGKKRCIITSQIEHPSVAAACTFLEKQGARILRLPVSSEGIVTPETLERVLNPDETALVSIMWVNNESGLINPIGELGLLCREKGVPFHTDGVQAVGKISIDLSQVPVDYMSFSAHKFHGPKGIGGLYVRKGAPFVPLLHGSKSQMGGKRAGTVNVAFLAAMGLAIELAVTEFSKKVTQIRCLRDRLEDALLGLDDVTVVGKRCLRTPNTVLASIRGVEGEALLWDLNKNGVAASTGSACSSEDLEPDPTFVALGIAADLAHTGVRFSLSRFTTDQEIDQAIEIIQKAVKRLRSISSSYGQQSVG